MAQRIGFILLMTYLMSLFVAPLSAQTTTAGDGQNFRGLKVRESGKETHTTILLPSRLAQNSVQNRRDQAIYVAILQELLDLRQRGFDVYGPEFAVPLNPFNDQLLVVDSVGNFHLPLRHSEREKILIGLTRLQKKLALDPKFTPRPIVLWDKNRRSPPRTMVADPLFFQWEEGPFGGTDTAIERIRQIEQDIQDGRLIVEPF